MTTNAIEVENLTKSYGQVRDKMAPVLAVDHINFQVRQGELFGFLGPNGAGKTSTINMLTGLARPDAGTIHIAGIDCSRNPKAAQHLIGIVPDDSNLYPELTGFDNLYFCAALYGMGKDERQARARELLDLFGLKAAADRKFGGYSKGMKRKLTIAAGIIHRPQILFLDEPTTGIDVESVRQIRQLIANLHRDGTTIFLTTHYIEEAERLCDRIAFIVQGQIARMDTVTALLQPVQAQQAMLFSVNNKAAELGAALVGAFPHLNFHTVSENQIRITAAEAIRIGPLVRFVEDQGVEVIEARRLQPSLEEVFVQVTGLAAETMKKEKERIGGGV